MITLQPFIDARLNALPVKKDKSPAVNKWANETFEQKDFIYAEGIGIMCGLLSDGLECFDFDNHFGDAKQTLSEFLNISEVKEIYEKNKLPIQSTQSGGFHLLYRCSNVGGNKKLASKPVYDEKIKKWKPDAIIETRGEGGYFVAAPTEGYKVIRNDIFQIAEISEEERDILIENACSFNQWSEPIKEYHEQENRPGDIYNEKPEAINEMKSALMEAGWTELNQYQWRRPDKKKGISATIGKVAENVFYNFSSNSYPFTEMSGYTPFRVVGLLRYNGDFKKFAKDLSKKYGLEKYENTKPDYGRKPEKKKKSESELDKILEAAFIDPKIPVSKPPVILEINRGSYDYPDYSRLMTLGNISAFTGKGKSKKTFLSSMVLAALAKNDSVQKKFRARLPINKKGILHFDTEQGEYDSWIVSKRNHQLSGGFKDHLMTFNLREYEPNERVEIIERAITHFGNRVSFIMIDGVADIVNDINDVNEAVSIVTTLMKWSKKHNVHISTVIHQNKNDKYATGHLGSALIKKSEVVISVEKHEKDSNYSNVSCDNIRGVHEFAPFSFYITSDGLPEIDWWTITTKINTNEGL